MLMCSWARSSMSRRFGGGAMSLSMQSSQSKPDARKSLTMQLRAFLIGLQLRRFEYLVRHAGFAPQAIDSVQRVLCETSELGRQRSPPGLLGFRTGISRTLSREYAASES